MRGVQCHKCRLAIQIQYISNLRLSCLRSLNGSSPSGRNTIVCVHLSLSRSLRCSGSRLFGSCSAWRLLRLCVQVPLSAHQAGLQHMPKLTFGPRSSSSSSASSSPSSASPFSYGLSSSSNPSAARLCLVPEVDARRRRPPGAVGGSSGSYTEPEAEDSSSSRPPPSVSSSSFTSTTAVTRRMSCWRGCDWACDPFARVRGVPRLPLAWGPSAAWAALSLSLRRAVDGRTGEPFRDRDSWSRSARALREPCGPRDLRVVVRGTSSPSAAAARPPPRGVPARCECDVDARFVEDDEGSSMFAYAIRGVNGAVYACAAAFHYERALRV